MYVRGGYNVYPVEVEAVLSSHPGVAAVAVVPRPDAVMGEIGVAFVVPRDTGGPPSLDDLRAFAWDRLAAYKLPEELARSSKRSHSPRWRRWTRRSARRRIGRLPKADGGVR